MKTKEKWEKIISILGMEKTLYFMMFLPQDIERIEYLYYLIYNLEGSYSAAGIRNWFHRTRKELGGKSPEDLIAGGNRADLEKIQHLSIMKETI